MVKIYAPSPPPQKTQTRKRQILMQMLPRTRQKTFKRVIHIVFVKKWKKIYQPNFSTQTSMFHPS